MGMRELRLKRGMTQKQLGDRIGVTQQRIAAFETGQRSAGGMSLDVAVRICDALHVKNPRKLLESESESSADSE
jgi:transcriptional regulator with XRE-family HTH domain